MNHFLRVRISFLHYGLLTLVIVVLGLPSTSTLLASIAQKVPESATFDNGLFYISEAGRFNIMMPMPISLREATLTYSFDLRHYSQLSGPSLDCHQLGAKDYGAVWLVMYCDYPPEVLADLTSDVILDSASGLIRSFYSGDLINPVSEQAITYDHGDTRFPGRSFVYHIDADGFHEAGELFTDTYQARAYLADKRLYWISAMVLAENWNNRLSLIDPFLESFYIETE